MKPAQRNRNQPVAGNIPLQVVQYHPMKTGLERWFGPTEAKIMTILWENTAPRPLSVRVIWVALKQQFGRELAYTTVMTTTSRLWEKGMLQREWVGGAYEYAARESMESFVTRNVAAIRASL